MRVLVVNAGSSSLKLRVLGARDAVLSATDVDRWEGAGDIRPLTGFLAGLDGVDAVGHRIVHGGTRFHGPVVLDPGMRAALADLADLAPLHQPRSLAGIDAVGAL